MSTAGNVELIGTLAVVTAVGVVLWKTGVLSALSGVLKAASDATAVPGDFFRGIEQGGTLQSGVDEARNPECHSSDPLCVKRSSTPHTLTDERGNPIVW